MRKIENWFSVIKTHTGVKKKLVARILKSEPLILKSKPLIFCPLKTRLKIVRKRRTNPDCVSASVFVAHRLGREACALRPVVRQLVEGAFLLQVVARMFVGAASYQRVAMP